MIGFLQDITNTSELASELAEIAEKLRNYTVQVRCQKVGGGSGVIWQADGLIITNAHVAQHSHAEVELADGRILQAVRTGFDPERDLAALKIEATDLPAAAIGDSDALRVGEFVLAMGNPFGVVGALTIGIIHAVGMTAGKQREELLQSRKSLKSSDWLIADVNLAPGNSGGLLANAQGQVIGINTAIADGLALAVPSKAVEYFLQYSVARPQLGVTMRPVPVQLGKRRIVGLLVLDIAFGSLAMAAGLSVGDILIGVFGQYFQSPEDLTSVLWHSKPGDTLPIEFLRGKRHCQKTVVMGNSRGIAARF